MKSVELAYGRTGLTADVADGADVLEPRYVPGLADESAAVVAALRSPPSGPALRNLVPKGARVGISVCDVTRPFPGRRVLPLILDELEAAAAGQISIFIATGTHRICTEPELDQMLGPNVRARCQVVQHYAFERDRHRQIGTVIGSSVPVLIQAGFLD